MPQPKSIPPGKGGKPYGKRSKSLVYNMVWLNRTYYLLFKLQAKFSKLSSPKIPTNYTNSVQFAHTVRKLRKIRTFYIMFQAPAPAENPAKFQRITQIPRNSPTQSGNSAKSAHFVKLILHHVSGTCPNRERSEIPANYANSAQFTHTVSKLREIRTIC